MRAGTRPARRKCTHDVAKITRPTSSGFTPEFSIARRAAVSAMVRNCSPGAITWRLEMPVRVLTHESDVSTSVARCSFVMTSSGAHAPTPIGFAFRRERPGVGATSAAAATLTSSAVVAKRGLLAARVTTGSDRRGLNVAPSTSEERPSAHVRRIAPTPRCCSTRQEQEQERALDQFDDTSEFSPELFRV